MEIVESILAPPAFRTGINVHREPFNRAIWRWELVCKLDSICIARTIFPQLRQSHSPTSSVSSASHPP